ncbi:MAG: hypothetical protein K6E59_05080 [Bacilli bacterium]|nr:hypothetical protein [Bacilli bacterium]
MSERPKSEEERYTELGLLLDENVRRFIFGYENKNARRLFPVDYAAIIDRTVCLVFLYVFACVRSVLDDYDATHSVRRSNSPYAKRVLRSVDRLYKDLDLSFEVMQFILLDVQFDLSRGESSGLREYIPGFESDFKIMDYADLIRRRINAPSRLNQELSIKDASATLLRLMTSLERLLPGLSLVEQRGEFCFLYKSKLRQHLFPCRLSIALMSVRDEEEFYYLEKALWMGKRADGGRGRTFQLAYMQLSSLDRLFVQYQQDDPDVAPSVSDAHTHYVALPSNQAVISTFEWVTNEVVDQNEDDGVPDTIQNIYAVNYKYLKNLALAISDFIDVDGHSQNQGILDTIGVDMSMVQDGNFDGAIIMLLVQRAPRVVLTNVCKVDPTAFGFLIRDLNMRFNGAVEFPGVQWENGLPNTIDLPFHSTIFGREGRVSTRVAEQQAEYIIRCILKSSEKDEGVERINEEIRSVKSGDLENAQKTLTRVLLRLTCFYYGLLAYGQQALENQTPYQPSAMDDNAPEDTIHDIFYEEAKRQYGRIRSKLTKKAPDDLRIAIREFSKLCADSQSERAMASALFFVLGKNRIVDTGKLNLSESLVDYSPNQQMEDIANILEFLNSGAYEKNEARGDFNSSIYPLVGKYVSKSNNSDKCEIVCFSLRMDVDSNGEADHVKEISILSEIEYFIDKSYYCLPNIGRCNSEWWIEPFVVRAGKFDKIFAE